jgi:hypothetical protein
MTKPLVVRHEYRVRYRRRSWKSTQWRLYQSVPPAQRLIDKLNRRRPDLDPVVELSVQRRVVGEWESVPVRGGRIYRPGLRERAHTNRPRS